MTSATTLASPPPDALATLVGRSAAMAALRERVRRVAASDCNVLVTGETGSGKECVAEALHRLGARAARPFVAINCAAFPDSLLDSELFGFERGAFTGATHAYPGKVVLADGGTLFLDEIGDMPVAAQAKLLRMIETREVFAIGALRPRKVDLRIVAATHCDLESAVRAGRFRADLYYRLNVARIEIAALRDRAGDVLELFEHFARPLAARSSCGAVRLSAAAHDALLRHDWPGNVRELRNVVEAAYLAYEGVPLPPEALPIAVAPGQAESTLILEALERCEWNRSKAAELLHWSRMTLYRKMKRLHILPAASA
jgi:DNA-binding NtrC family response regulator